MKRKLAVVLCALLLPVLLTAGTRNGHPYHRDLAAFKVVAGEDSTFAPPWECAYYEIYAHPITGGSQDAFDVDITLYYPNGDTTQVGWATNYRSGGDVIKFFGPKIDSMRVVCEAAVVDALVLLYKDD